MAPVLCKWRLPWCHCCCCWCCLRWRAKPLPRALTGSWGSRASEDQSPISVVTLRYTRNTPFLTLPRVSDPTTLYAPHNTVVCVARQCYPNIQRFRMCSYIHHAWKYTIPSFTYCEGLRYCTAEIRLKGAQAFRLLFPWSHLFIRNSTIQSFLISWLVSLGMIREYFGIPTKNAYFSRFFIRSLINGFFMFVEWVELKPSRSSFPQRKRFNTLSTNIYWAQHKPEARKNAELAFVFRLSIQPEVSRHSDSGNEHADTSVKLQNKKRRRGTDKGSSLHFFLS